MSDTAKEASTSPQSGVDGEVAPPETARAPARSDTTNAPVTPEVADGGESCAVVDATDATTNPEKEETTAASSGDDIDIGAEDAVEEDAKEDAKEEKTEAKPEPEPLVLRGGEEQVTDDGFVAKRTEISATDEDATCPPPLSRVYGKKVFICTRNGSMFALMQHFEAFCFQLLLC